MRLFHLREEYRLSGRDRMDLHSDPIEQFRHWLAEAVAAGIREPNAAALATASAAGRPSVRMVLLKSFDDSAFVFATNYASRKGRELAANPWASLVFYWAALERQVRVEGAVMKSPPEESDEIFRSRPRGAQLATWISEQSSVIDGREVLETRLGEAERRYPTEVPRPPFWGALRIAPASIEFWQGRPHRLHDRLVYQRQDAGGWRTVRLAP